MKKKVIPIIFSFFSIFGFAQNEVPTATEATSGTLTITASVTYTSPYFYTVWIMNPTGTFLRTLTMYGNNTSYYSDLVHWTADTNKNKVNAVTGATKSSIGTYTTLWDGKDQANLNLVADGIYTVRIEMTSESYKTNSKYITTTFTKNTTAQTIRPTAVSPMSNISVVWAPINTAINDVEMEKLYAVYPNPAISSVFVSGTDIKEIEICSLTGKSILTTNEQNVNISNLAKGTYLAVIRAKTGTVVKKFIKR